MLRINSQLGLAALSALLLVCVSPGTSEAIYFGIFILIIFIVADLIVSSIKKFLLSAFRIPLMLIIVATLFEIANLKFPLGNSTYASVAIMAVLLMSFSAKNFLERVATAFYFFIITSLLAICLTHVKAKVFYPILFLIVAFVLPVLNQLLLSVRKRKQ